MTEIESIIMSTELTMDQKMAALTKKTVVVPAWEKLEKEYDPKKHPVMTDPHYKDVVRKGRIENVTKVALGWQKLATKRMAALLCGIPVKRIYQPADDQQKAAAQAIEAIYKRNRIDAVNLERARYLYAACECVTIWYAQDAPARYGELESQLKLRCRNYSPIKGDQLYPLFDDYDDLVALSVKYARLEGTKTVTYFDTYTDSMHVCWNVTEGTEVLHEKINIGKIAGVYIHRDEPVWEDESNNVYEAEWTYSRNGNYIRKNSRPKLAIYSDEKVKTGKAPTGDEVGTEIVRLGREDKMEFVTWNGSTEAIKFHIQELKYNFNSQLQLPDVSMDSMKSTPMSGESRKMLFMDAQMKVTNEAGAWLEMYDREYNVVKAYAKRMFPDLAEAIDALAMEHLITPYQVRDDKERVETLATAAGTVASRKTCIKRLGWVDDPEEELQQMSSEQTEDVFSPME